MISQFANPCVRCGTERIESRTWKEKIKTFHGMSILMHAETICPDPVCQKFVDRDIAARRLKKEAMEKIKEERLDARKQLIILRGQSKN